MKIVYIIPIIIGAIFSITLASSVDAQGNYSIPSWVKGIASFWAEDKISDQEFGEGLAFLIDQGIIEIPKISELENKVAQLEAEIISLENQDCDCAPIEGSTQSPEDCGPNQVIQNNQCIDIVDDTDSQITLKTDQSSYYDGDIITITGNVGNISESFQDAPVTIIVTSTTGNIVSISSILPSSNGSFSQTLIAGGSMNESGIYQVSAQYGSQKATTTFSFTASDSTPPPPPPSASSIPEPNCDPSYPDVCIPPYPPDLDCGEIGYSNFRVTGSDPHGFDGDNDGIGCES